MGHLYIVSAALGGAAVLVGSFFCVYQLYRLVQVDAECRGLKHPRLWGLLAASGNGQSGLLLYLVGRRKHPVLSMSKEQKDCMGRRKKRFGVGLLFLTLGAVICVLSMLLGGQMG